MTLSSELLPAPLGPIRAQISPRPTSKLRSRSAVMPLKVKDTPCSWRSGVIACSGMRRNAGVGRVERQALLLALDLLDVAIACGGVAGRQIGAVAEQLLAQGPGLVGPRIDAATLQLGNQVADDIGEGLVRHRIGEVEAVDVGFLDPRLQDVGNGRRR